METEAFWERIRQSDMILVGLGEEFNGGKRLRQQTAYLLGRDRLKAEGLSWLIPAWNEYWLEQTEDFPIRAALEKLEALLEGRNHFIVSVSVNRKVEGLGRSVMPCGFVSRKQCAGGCPDVLYDVTDEDVQVIKSFFQDQALGQFRRDALGRCPQCGAPLALNNIYAEHYNENGYLDQWKLYMKWLQGTLNHRLLVLELGVGMEFPSVIRWPFEKTVYFNQKAFLYRVNENLYHLTEELAGKGCGISENAVDWLARL